MEVNFMGAFTTSQAFIPLLRSGQQKGRIVNVSSVVGARSWLDSCSRCARCGS
jgi:NAD(P)-dependent dehydrogenase (short-subunit alcohol dehydrogenase family)